PARLVIEEQPRTLARRQRLAVDQNDIVLGDVERRRVDDAAVDGDAALRDHLLGVAPRGQASARQHLRNALAGLLRLRIFLTTRPPVEITIALAIGTAASEGRTPGEYLTVVLIVAARPVAEAAFAARMLLPVHAALRPLVARPAELRTVFAKAFLARARETRTIFATAATLTPVVALTPRLFVTAIAATKILIEFLAERLAGTIVAVARAIAKA